MKKFLWSKELKTKTKNKKKQKKTKKNNTLVQEYTDVLLPF